MVGIWSWIIYLTFFDRSLDIAMAISFRGKIGKIGKIGLLTFIRRSGIPKRWAR